MMWRMWLPGGWYDNKKNSALAPIGSKQGEWVAGHNLVGVSAPVFKDVALVRYALFYFIINGCFH